MRRAGGAQAEPAGTQTQREAELELRKARKGRSARPGTAVFARFASFVVDLGCVAGASGALGRHDGARPCGRVVAGGGGPRVAARGCVSGTSRIRARGLPAPACKALVLRLVSPRHRRHTRFPPPRRRQQQALRTPRVSRRGWVSPLILHPDRAGPIRPASARCGRCPGGRALCVSLPR